MNRFWSKYLLTLAASRLFALNEEACRDCPGYPALQIALARGLARDGDGAGAVAPLNRGDLLS